MAEMMLDGFLGERGGVDGHAPFFGEDLKTGGVIPVLVGEQDAIQRGGIEAGGLQAQGDLLGAEAGIDQQRGVIRGHDGAVAGTAAAEDREFQHVEINRSPGWRINSGTAENAEFPPAARRWRQSKSTARWHSHGTATPK